MLYFLAYPRTLQWLPVRKRITYKLCVLMFDVCHGTAPEYLTNLCSRCDDQRLRSSVRRDSVVRQTRTRLANSSFTVAEPAAWNLLPVSIRNTNSDAAFCRQLKTYLFSTPDWLPYLCSLHCVYSVLSVRRCWAPVEWRHSKLWWWWWWWTDMTGQYLQHVQLSSDFLTLLLLFNIQLFVLCCTFSTLLHLMLDLFHLLLQLNSTQFRSRNWLLHCHCLQCLVN